MGTRMGSRSSRACEEGLGVELGRVLGLCEMGSQGPYILLRVSSLFLSQKTHAKRKKESLTFDASSICLVPRNRTRSIHR